MACRSHGHCRAASLPRGCSRFPRWIRTARVENQDTGSIPHSQQHPRACHNNSAGVVLLVNQLEAKPCFVRCCEARRCPCGNIVRSGLWAYGLASLQDSSCGKTELANCCNVSRTTSRALHRRSFVAASHYGARCSMACNNASMRCLDMVMPSTALPLSSLRSRLAASSLQRRSCFINMSTTASLTFTDRSPR
jgi:hypothetical protein